MKRHALSLLTALCICVGLCVPALAAETPPFSDEEAYARISVSHDIGADTYVEDKSLPLVAYEITEKGEEEAGRGTLDGYVAILDDTTFTVKHNGTADDGSYIVIYLSYYWNDGDGVYCRWDYPSADYLTKDGFAPNYMDPEQYGGLVELRAGESVQFSLPTERAQGRDVIYFLEATLYYPQYDCHYTSFMYCAVDGDTVQSILANQGASTEPTEPTAPAFTDVPADAYYAEPVAWAVENGITSGTSDTTFGPDSTCTTAQILMFLWRAVGSPAPAGENPFGDVAADAYYADAAAWAYENGLVSGATFGGNAPCTRSATVTYLWKLAGSPAAEPVDFTDVAADADYAQAVAWAVQEGITAGTGDATFGPDSTCTRGQIMTFLFRDLAQ